MRELVRLAFVLCLICCVETFRSQAIANPSPDDADAPWKHVLQGADAKRVDELEKRVTELR